MVWFGLPEFFEIAFVFLAAFLSVLLIMPWLIRFMHRKGMVGQDIHMVGTPLVAEMGGIGILFGVSLGGAVSLFFFPEYFTKIAGFLSSILIVGAIGVVDDVRGMNPKLKAFLTMLGVIPIILTGSFEPRPEIPIIGQTRLTIVYWLFLPFSIAVTSNAVNMMDVQPGVMPATSSIALLSMLAGAALLGHHEGLILIPILLGALLAYYRYNRYPPRVFAGDTGSLAVGAGLGAIAIISRIEFVTIIAMMPFIINGFHELASLRGLLERHQITARPTLLEENRDEKLLKVNPDRKAPIVLASLFLLKGPMTEETIVKCYIAVTITSAILAVISAAITPLP